jgi:DNA polymerase-3 subunit delta
MTPEQALQEARGGSLRPVYLVLGQDSHLQATVVMALREAAVEGGPTGLNEDQLVAGEQDVDAVLSTARTLPMMARRRWVLVRSLERWESRTDVGSRSKTDELSRLADYCDNPVSSTVLVLVATKLDGRRRLLAAAKKGGWLVRCDPLSRKELTSWISRTARGLGCQIPPAVADLIAELAGPELSGVSNAVEHVCLFAGPRTITEDDVAECVVRLRPTEVWELGNAVGRRDLGAALATLDRVYDPQDRGIRLVGVLAWSARRLLRFEAALTAGLPLEQAAAHAGAPAFVARDLARQLKQTTPRALEEWLETLAEVDQALKGGSRRPPKAILEYALVQTCRAAGRSGARDRRVAPGP